MQWDELMKQFADLVGRAMASRWLAQRSASRHQEKETGRESTGKTRAQYPPESQRPRAAPDHE